MQRPWNGNLYKIDFFPQEMRSLGKGDLGCLKPIVIWFFVFYSAVPELGSSPLLEWDSWVKFNAGGSKKDAKGAKITWQLSVLF